MALKEILFLVIHWIHTIAAVAWIGGGLFYIFILRNQKGRFSIELDASLRKDFRALVTTAMGILLVTGSVMTFDRLTSGFVGGSYAIVLAAKIVLAVYMFYLVWSLKSRVHMYRSDRGSSHYRHWTSALSGGTMVVALGIIVFLLADILGTLFEIGLKG